MTLSLHSFETRVPGKWILAGEHAVIRGSPAVVFPLHSRSLELSFIPGEAALRLDLGGEHGEELQLLFWGVLEKACEKKKIRREELRGTLKLQSSIPIGAGLGASAALCVALTRWFQAMKLISVEEMYEFARQLENLFHGESSGVDIAVALSAEPIYFVRGGERRKVTVNWQPKWYVSYSGKRGVTLECVNKVKAMIEKNPEAGTQIDQDMNAAVLKAEKALQATSEAEGFPLLKEAIDQACSCFERWGLTVDSHLQWLREQGAVAVKPTGSGNGGYVLSLWQHEPPSACQKLLIPCF